ncbi:DinB family protein [Pedobacter sp. LMG 31464]|uniref:DinB family protein n=1 Tax=Pedobacter planticolens TaxID=2679964 RepID=A0A923DXJ9_9SPHI|nr:DinB family protein [Pedobacter planticolens]MBB2145881.1 DinB family protein [Pedobacter planticolens]
MNIIELLLKELESEAQTTRKFLALVPFDKAEWAPHEKSMKMMPLSTHIAELPSWISLGLTTDELDFSTAPYEPIVVNNNEELLAIFEKNYEGAKEELAKAKEEELTKRWVLRNGEQILSDMDKYGIIRIAFSQTTHHRAQLGVYFRLLDIPVPASYGPTADDHSF